MALDHVHVVLSRPSEPRNVGAVCRAIKNAGISRLTIATATTIDFEAARPLAVDAKEILDSAQVVPDLATALTGSSLIAGVTRRVGQRRKFVSFAPWQFAAKVTAGSPDRAEAPRPEIAVVFGNEQSGLTDAELEHCHMAVSIPSSPEFPSLNLSHAVQIIAYELYVADLAATQASGHGPDPGTGIPAAALEELQQAARGATGHEPIDEATLKRNIARITTSLENLGYQIQDGPQGFRQFLTDILGRAMLSETEAVRLATLFEKLDGMHRPAPPRNQ